MKKEKQILKSIDDMTYTLRCIRCGGTSNLESIPHRIKNGVVGMIFCCKDCKKLVYNSEIKIDYKN